MMRIFKYVFLGLFIVSGCKSSTADIQVEVTPTIVIQHAGQNEEDIAYMIAVKLEENDIKTDLSFDTFQADLNQLQNAFSTPDESIEVLPRCKEWSAKQLDTRGRVQSMCSYIEYTEESEERAKEALLEIKFYDADHRLIYEYEDFYDANFELEKYLFQE